MTCSCWDLIGGRGGLSKTVCPGRYDGSSEKATLNFHLKRRKHDKSLNSKSFIELNRKKYFA